MSLGTERASPSGAWRRRASLGIRLAALLGFVPASAPTAAIEFSTRWIWSDFAANGGPEELLVEDFDQDGRDEILGTAGAPWGGPFGTESWWYLGTFGDSYRQVWSSLPLPGYFADATLATEGGRLRVVFRTEVGFLVIDVASRETVRTLPAPTSQIWDHVVADLDGDAEPELVGCSGSSVFVISFQTGALLREAGTSTCRRVGVGQADGDPALEILVTSPSDGATVLDGSSLAVEWSEIEAGVGWAQFANVDDDLVEELLLATGGGLLAVDVATASTLWERTDLPNVSAAVGEIDSTTAGQELVVLDFDQNPTVLSARTGQFLWAVETWSGPASSVQIGDVLGAGSNQIVFTVTSSAEAEAVVVFEPIAREVAGVAHKLGFPTPAFQVVDGMGDGQLRIWTGTHDGPIPAAGFDLVSRGIIYATSPPIAPSERGRSTTAQLDLDSASELCWITCDDCGEPGLRCADLATHDTQWSVQFAGNTVVTSLAAHDLDGDGITEVLVGAASMGVFAFEGASGWLRWRTPVAAFGTSDFGTIRVTDLDSDGALEIVAGGRSSKGTGQGHVWVFDATTGAVENGPSTFTASALDVADLDGEGGPEIVTGDVLGSVRVLDPTTGTSSPPLVTASGAVRALRIADFDRDGVPEIASVASSRLEVFDQLVQDPVWTSPSLGQFAGRDDSLFISDANRNGIPELLVSTIVGFAIFEGRGQLLFEDGFESGDTSAWSSTLP